MVVVIMRTFSCTIILSFDTSTCSQFTRSLFYLIYFNCFQVHHTATHLLQAALKTVMGQDTSQAGSLVAFDRLRFDFNFHRPLSDNEIMEIEVLINQWIGDATSLQTKVMPLEDAKKAGAIAMFGEKYGEQVCYSSKLDIYTSRNGELSDNLSTLFVLHDANQLLDSFKFFHMLLKITLAIHLEVRKVSQSILF